MAEWSKATVSKIVVGATSPRVQIPLSPPFFLPKKRDSLNEMKAIPKKAFLKSKKMANEAARLHFTEPSGSTSHLHAATAALHPITLRLACLSRHSSQSGGG